jgi:hypothetical protein
MGYLYPMGIQDDRRNQMVAKNNKNQQTSSYFDQSNFPSSDNNGFLPYSMGSNFSGSKPKRKNKSKKRNGEIISRREESRDSLGKRKIILPHKLNEYQVELHRPIRSEDESEASERISNSPKEVVKLYEETNFESKRDNSDLPSTSSLSSPNKEVQIQKYIDKDRQYSSNVQNQKEIKNNESLSYSKEDMETIREKLLNIKSDPYSRKDKCSNRQTESTRNEQRLSIKRNGVSKNTKNVALLSKSRSLRIQKESTNKDICISNFLRRSGQHKKRLKIKLVNHKRSRSSTSADLFSTESIEEVQRGRKNTCIDSSFLEGLSMDRLVRKPDYHWENPKTY